MRRFALLLYRALLRFAPRSLREKHGREMVELFESDLAEASAHGPIAAVRTIMGGVIDLIRRIPYEHRRRRGRTTPNAPKEARMQSLISDIRYALRSFGRQPGPTALVLTTLSLAVAANVAVFALVDAVFFRPLPYANASRLVDINETAPAWGLDFTGVNYPDFVAWRTGARAFEAMGLWDDAGFNLADTHGSERIEGQQVTYDLMRALGVHPVLGRGFTAEEDVPNGPNVAMIGFGLWQQRFGGTSDVIGKIVRIGSAPYTIVGVLPRNVTLDGPATIWLPLQGDPKQQGQNYSYEGVGRLKAGVTIDQARKDIERAHLPVWHQNDTSHTVSPRLMPLRDRFVADYRTMGAALGAGVVLVLFIACANVAGAMLARSVSRRREIGIRAALGASTSRLTRQLLTESLTLGVLGGVVGTVIGRLGTGLLMAGVDSPPPWLDLRMDARTVAFSVIIVLATTLLFGLAPSIQARKAGTAGALIGGTSRVAGSLPERRLLNGLVVAEITLATVLLASGGLLVRAYENLRNVDPGFRADGVATFRVSLPAAKYADGLSQRRFYETLVARIRQLPGVTSAGAVTCAPFTCQWGTLLAAEGAPTARAGASQPIVLTRIATPGYFESMGIRLLSGRYFAENEGTPDGPRPTVINEQLAKQLWPDGSSPLGKRFGFLGDTSQRLRMTVVGVVRDVRHYGLTRPMIGGMYMPMTSIDTSDRFPRFQITAHTAGDPTSLFASMRAVMHDLDPELPMFDSQTMRAALDRSLASRRALALWLAAFAGLALLLAVGGIYAVLSYVVGRRRHEIGIRMALGARSQQVLGLVVRQGLVLVAIGLVIGLPVALLSTHYLSSLLVGVSATDPLTYVCVVMALAATGALAAAIPARRAARVDPKVALSEAT